MTNSWTDIGNADVVLVMGGNAAEAHPCGFKWVTEAKHNHGAKLIVVDPRRTETAEKADTFLQVRPGGDAHLMLAMLGTIVQEGLEDKAFIAERTVGYDEIAPMLRAIPVEDREAELLVETP